MGLVHFADKASLTSVFRNAVDFNVRKVFECRVGRIGEGNAVQCALMPLFVIKVRRVTMSKCYRAGDLSVSSPFISLAKKAGRYRFVFS